MANFHSTTLAESLLQEAGETIKASVIALCERYAPLAKDVFALLAANGGNYEKELASFGRPERSLVLEFSKDIRAGNAAIPGLRLFWTIKQGPKDTRERKCLGVLTGEAADTYTPLVTDRTNQKGKVKGKSLSDLIQQVGLTLQEVATQSGAPLGTLEALCRGEGKLLSTRAGGLAVILKVPHDDVRKAFNVSRHHAAMGFRITADTLGTQPAVNATPVTSVDTQQTEAIPPSVVSLPYVDGICSSNSHINKTISSRIPRTTITKVVLPDGRHGEFTFRYV